MRPTTHRQLLEQLDRKKAIIAALRSALVRERQRRYRVERRIDAMLKAAAKAHDKFKGDDV